MQLKYNKSKTLLTVILVFMFSLLVLYLWQSNNAWVLRYRIGKLVEKKEELENTYQQLLAEKAKLTSYSRIKELAEKELNMKPYSSVPIFLKKIK